MHMPGEFHDCSWVLWFRHCSRKGARHAEERKKMTFHCFQVCHFSNNFEQPYDGGWGIAKEQI